MHRKQCVSIYEHLYRKFYHSNESKWICFYCGEPGNELDHQPPITRIDDYRALYLERQHYVKVISCRECNAIAADILHETLLERKEYIANRLWERYRSILKTPHWRKEELAELSGRLRQSVAASASRADLAMARIEYTDGTQAYWDFWDAETSECVA